VCAVSLPSACMSAGRMQLRFFQDFVALGGRKVTRQEMTGVMSEVDRTAGREPRNRYSTDQMSAFYERVSGVQHPDDPNSAARARSSSAAPVKMAAVSPLARTAERPQRYKEQVQAMLSGGYDDTGRHPVETPAPPIPDEVYFRADDKGPVVVVPDIVYLLMAGAFVLVVFMVWIDQRNR
jgi:hypothetical protein